MEKLIIVPDVHGRTFWKDIMGYKDTPVVFLGDYLDPYPRENIGKRQAIDNFLEILDYSKQNDNVTLLLGNHDMEYSIGTHICDCRRDVRNYKTIRNLFLDNSNMFTLAVDFEAGGKKFFISHAGITQRWYEENKEVFGVDSYNDVLNANLINKLFFEGKLDDILGQVSLYRGGWNDCGSIVWADFREHIYVKPMDYNGTIQIVGHTMLIGNPVDVTRDYEVCCVDSKKCVYLDENGIVEILVTKNE